MEIQCAASFAALRPGDAVICLFKGNNRQLRQVSSVTPTLFRVGSVEFYKKDGSARGDYRFRVRAELCTSREISEWQVAKEKEDLVYKIRGELSGDDLARLSLEDVQKVYQVIQDAKKRA